MKPLPRGLRILGVVAFAYACGNDASPTVSVQTPRPAPTPTVTPCAQTTVSQGTVPFARKTVGFTSISTATAGRLDVTLDWTHAENTMQVAVIEGACNPDDFDAGRCTVLVRALSPPKPAKASIQLAAGLYSLVIKNDGNVDDRVTYLAVLSDPACPLR
jgi:hypothetical protein